jgi:hypothetical protein
MTLPLPRYVIPKRLAGGSTAFYFNVPTRYRKLGCTIPNEPLGNDYTIACGADGKGGRAAALNGLLDEWIKIRNGEQIDNIVRYGTVDLHPEPAAAAVICFEWLQRPENVLAGCITWSDYRGRNAPTAIKIEHHKTGAEVWHPLEEVTPDGTVIRFYEDAEAVLGHLPKRGVPLILKLRRDGKTTDSFRPNHMAKRVRKLADRFDLPSTFTLDACRHGGMTELEEAELTTGQGRALSGHRTDRAYVGYAKTTMRRALAATRRRHAHRTANGQGTSVQNDTQNAVQNAHTGK